MPHFEAKSSIHVDSVDPIVIHGASPSSATPGRQLVLLLPEDDYRRLLAAYLRRQGFSVTETDDAQAAIAHVMNDAQVDVLVTASDLPDVPVIDLLSRLRGLGSIAPIALLADDYSEAHEEVALECGASEFVCRSRRYSIIAKRLRLLAEGVKRPSFPERSSADGIRVSHLVLRPYSHRVLWKDREVPLTVTEFRIVRLLACRTGEQVSYREIYDFVHGVGFCAGDGAEGYRTNVRSLIRKIRKKFMALDPQFDEIENCAGFGYRWRSTTSVAAFPRGAATVVEQNGRSRPAEVATAEK